MNLDPRRQTDKLSLGAGLNIMYGSFSTTVGINKPSSALGDGQLKLDDSEISYATRLGLQYTTEIILVFKSDPEFSGLGSLMTAGLDEIW